MYFLYRIIKSRRYRINICGPVSNGSTVFSLSKEGKPSVSRLPRLSQAVVTLYDFDTSLPPILRNRRGFRTPLRTTVPGV